MRVLLFKILLGNGSLPLIAQQAMMTVKKLEDLSAQEQEKPQSHHLHDRTTFYTLGSIKCTLTAVTTNMG